tara:strand:+ start:328 stop:741 length:414 start_codon:yes stop_codon:yes gene_type:complete
MKEYIATVDDIFEDVMSYRESQWPTQIEEAFMVYMEPKLYAMMVRSEFFKHYEEADIKVEYKSDQNWFIPMQSSHMFIGPYGFAIKPMVNGDKEFPDTYTREDIKKSKKGYAYSIAQFVLIQDSCPEEKKNPRKRLG